MSGASFNFTDYVYFCEGSHLVDKLGVLLFVLIGVNSCDL